MPLIIRRYQPADRERVAAQFFALNAFEESLAGNRWLDPVAGFAGLDHTLQRIADVGGATLVAQMDGQIVAHLCLIFAEDSLCVRPDLRSYAHVAELFVRTEHRRHGIGRALLAEAERHAAAAGRIRLTIGVLAGNRPAEALYVSRGFAPRTIELSKTLSPMPS